METFRIIVELETAIVTSKDTFLTLDAVCFGILSDLKEMGLSVADPLEGIPLKRQDGLFFASRAFFDNAVLTNITKIGGIRPVKDMEDAPTRFSTARKAFPKIDTTKGTFKSHLSRYQEVACDNVSWIATGEPEKVAALIKTAGAIGALRKDGYGKVRSVTYEIDPDLDPLMDSGNPLRPIPENHILASGMVPSTPILMDTWKPPYYVAADRTACFVPRA